MDRTDENGKLWLAPLIGLVAGLMAFMAFQGSGLWLLLGEMILGAIALTGLAAAGLSLSKVREDADRERNKALEQLSRDQRMASRMQAEAKRFNSERERQEIELLVSRRMRGLEQRLEKEEARNCALSTLLSKISVHSKNEEGDALARIEALEMAQSDALKKSVEIGARALREAEEVKASLRELSITDSQRQRNIDAPESDQSGRIIELEARIRRLAREIERLSQRQPVAAVEEGKASLVKEGGTNDDAKVGFLKAMLDANLTLRNKIQSAA